MTISFLSVLFLGLLMGIKHSLEPDHVIAVATVAGKGKKLWISTLTGVFWGIGHTLTLFIVGIAIILLKGGISAEWAMSLEFLVGIMLVYFGIKSILTKKEQLQDTQLHQHSYVKSTFIGFIHGLAGSAAMVLLTISTVNSVWESIIYILVFGVGTILGMMFFTTIIGLPFVYSRKNIGVSRSLTMLTGAVSFGFGLYYMYNLGVNEGLFTIWLK
ncbi:urease accessory protein UreH [Metabacillus sp. HB246100]|uniref:urease accessory protein UreH n=1 Tax=Bacillus weihaiensis TaxID=1547283 RepID=UPI0023574EFF|nr:urease accessory protein UreH [Bacillus weihaiensis]